MGALKFVGPVAGISSNFPASSLSKFCSLAPQIYHLARSHASLLWIFVLLHTCDHRIGDRALDVGRSVVAALPSCRKHTNRQTIDQLTKDATPFHTGRHKSRYIPVYNTAIPWSLIVCDRTQEQRGILVCGQPPVQEHDRLLPCPILTVFITEIRLQLDIQPH